MIVAEIVAVSCIGLFILVLLYGIYIMPKHTDSDRAYGKIRAVLMALACTISIALWIMIIQFIKQIIHTKWS